MAPMKKVALLLAVLVVFGCGGGGDVLGGGTGKPVVRLVTVVNGTNVNGTITNTSGLVTVLNNQPFASAGVAQVDTGIRQVTFTDPSNNVLASSNESLFEGQSYTVVAFGPAAGVQLRTLNETYAPAGGNAAVRILQAGGAGNQTVDIFTGAAGSDIAAATKIQDDLASGSSMLFRDIAAGTTKFFVTDPANQNNVLVSDEIALVAGKHYTLIIAPNGTLNLVTVTED